MCLILFIFGRELYKKRNMKRKNSHINNDVRQYTVLLAIKIEYDCIFSFQLISDMQTPWLYIYLDSLYL